MGEAPEAADPYLHHRVQQFLYLEAELLDDRRFDEWIALFEPDGEYWVPMAWRQPDPHQHISLIYENVDVLTMRMQRLKELAALSQRPFSRTCHQVTNITVRASSETSLTVRSALIVVEYRRNEQRTFAGYARHLLTGSGGSFRIRSKRVDLLNSDTDSGHIRISIPF
jgi:3-phenylpropionate/cinnamic acid dioxygenase small subunit